MSEAKNTLSSFEMPYHAGYRSLYWTFERDAEGNIVEVGEQNTTLGFQDPEDLRAVAHDMRCAAEALEAIARRRDNLRFDDYLSNHTERLP